MKTIETINATAERKSQAAKNRYDFLEALRREDDNTIFGWRCRSCQGAWKIYQSPYHSNDCPHFNKGPKAL